MDDINCVHAFATAVGSGVLSGHAAVRPSPAAAPPIVAPPVVVDSGASADAVAEAVRIANEVCTLARWWCPCLPSARRGIEFFCGVLLVLCLCCQIQVLRFKCPWIWAALLTTYSSSNRISSTAASWQTNLTPNRTVLWSFSVNMRGKLAQKHTHAMRINLSK